MPDSTKLPDLDSSKLSTFEKCPVSDDRLHRLYRILDRARRRAALESIAKAKLKAANRTKSIAEDYAARLAEKAKFRALLADEQMDGWRFRYFFTKVENERTLDEMRAWIDSRVAQEKVA